jgi:osmotically-inducible protein OsmY
VARLAAVRGGGASLAAVTGGSAGLAAALLWLGAVALSGCTPVGAVVGAGAVGGVAIAQERPVGEALSDVGIKTEINYDLFRAHIDDLFRSVNVDVVEGRVLLTGRVKTAELRDRAAKLAWQADGVRTVINETEIDDQSGPIDGLRDRWITTRLRGQILSDRRIYDINYAITTSNSVVYLIGIARSQAELDRVIEHARTVSHVRKIVSHVVLKDSPERPQ